MDIVLQLGNLLSFFNDFLFTFGSSGAPVTPDLLP